MKSKDVKRQEADERQLCHDALTPRQKLNKLDRRLGKKFGAVKERAKLQSQIKKTKKIASK
jgi:hypothetical protein